MFLQQHKWFGGVLLIAGTTIGGGMLALPVSTGLSGFIPSSLLLIAYWVFMTYTAFLMLEVNLWMEKRSNLVSMAHFTLGKWGEAVSWVTYLFLLYSLTTAYIAGSSNLFLDGYEGVVGTSLPTWVGPLPLLLVFGFFVWMGTESVDLINRLLMLGLFIAFGVMVVALVPNIDVSLLDTARWDYILLGVSIVSVSFGYHIIIPTLTTYMERDVKQLIRSIWIGGLIPLGIYLVWQALSLGTVPVEGECSLTEGVSTGSDIVTLLVGCLQHGPVRLVARFLSFFMILTSFLGVSISLSDFLADGLHVKKSGRGKSLIYGLTFIPPLLFVWYNPNAFITALGYAGAFGVVILLALMPALMAWAGRYSKGYKGPFRTWGGKPALVVVILLSLFVIGTEVGRLSGWVTL